MRNPTSNDAPVVSVIVPVYNHAETVGRSIRSALAQTFQHIEIIVIDDASTDALEDALSSLGDKRLRLIAHESNKGAAAARNTGAANARGKYMAFLDADDRWNEGKLAAQVEYLETAPHGIKACCTDFELTTPRGDTEIHRATDRVIGLPELVFGCSCSPGSTLMVERKCFEEVGEFDTGLRRLEDWDWLIRYSKGNRLAILDTLAATVHHCRTPNYEETLRSIEGVKERHLRADSIPSFILRLGLYSGLLIEIAAANFRMGRHFKSIGYVFLSLLVYPARKAVFFKRIFKRGRDAFSSSKHPPRNYSTTR